MVQLLPRRLLRMSGFMRYGARDKLKKEKKSRELRLGVSLFWSPKARDAERNP